MEKKKDEKGLRVRNHGYADGEISVCMIIFSQN